MRERLGDLRGRGLWVVLGCLVCQLGLGFGYIYSPLLTDITEDLGWTRTMFSSARAPLLFVIAFASPLIGALAVRFGARRVLTTSTILFGVPALIVSGMTELWQFYAANIVLGLVVTGLGDIAVGAVVSQWVVRGRGLALGIVYTGSNLAGLILPLLVTTLALQGSWRPAMLFIGIGGVMLMTPFAFFAVREPRAGEGPDVPIDAGAAAGGAEHAETVADLDLRTALGTRSFWILSAALFGFFFYFLGLLEHLVPALTDSGMEKLEAAGYYSFAIGMGLFSKIGMGLFADRLPTRTALWVDYGLLAVSALLLPFVPKAGFLQVFLVTYGFSTAARDVIYPLIIAHCFGVRYLAQIYGAMMLVLAPAGSLGSIYPAMVHDRTGSYETAFSGYAVLMLLVLASLFFVRDERRASIPGGPR
jgi:MFS family permease